MGKPDSVKAPKVPDPIAEVVTGDQAGDEAQKRAMKRSGFKRNVLAGQLTPLSGKNTVLG